MQQTQTVSLPKINVSLSNTKLGKVPSFSLPSVASCPGHTALCASICYAHKVERIYKNAKASYEVNFSAIKDSNFSDALIAELNKLTSKKKNPVDTFRFHVSGDIADIKYLYDMVKVIKHFPNVAFYAYTRNWAIPEWRPHLEKLRQLSNMTLFASVDDDHIAQKNLPDSAWRVAYVGDLSLTDIKKYTHANMIQCVEQTKGTTCDKCQYCFKPSLANTNLGVYFVKH